MAYLNVRERRLETKIAYVGPAQSGKGTNFEHLGGGTMQDDVLALYWQPKGDVTFRDCDVRVHLVAARGDASGDRVKALLRDVDGVVFVADAAPSAQEKNRETLAALRAALASSPKRDLPVVVQVNKSDLSDALPAADVVGALDITDLPLVSAAAVRGEGVVETAERALVAVLETLRTRAPTEAAASTSASAPREGNPLLSALRDILRETVATHVTEMEIRLEAKLDRALATSCMLEAKILAQDEVMTALGAALQATNAEVTRWGESNAKTAREHATTLATTLASTRRAVDVLGADLKDTRATLKAELDALGRETALIRPRVTEAEGAIARRVRDSVDGLDVHVTEVGAATNGTRTELAARTTEILAQFEALLQELKTPKKGWFG